MLYAVNMDIIKTIMGEKRKQNRFYMQDTSRYVFVILKKCMLFIKLMLYAVNMDIIKKIMGEKKERK